MTPAKAISRWCLGLAAAWLCRGMACPAQWVPGPDGHSRISLHWDDYDEAVTLVGDGQDTLWLLGWTGHSDTAAFDADVVVVKLHPDGLPAAGFGVAGTVRTDFAGMDHSTARCMVRQPDGSLMVLGAGSLRAQPGISPLCVMRLTAQGVPDSSFGVGGTATLAFYGGQEFPGDLRTGDSGGLWLAGGSWDSLGLHNVPVLARCDAALRPDSSFGGTGRQVLDFVGGMTPLRGAVHLTGGEAYALLPLPDGGVLVGGSYGAEAFVARLTAAGALDSAFGGAGHLLFQVTPFFNNWTQCMALLQDGSLLVGVNDDRIPLGDFHLLRLDAATGDLLDLVEVDHAGGDEELLAMLPEGDALTALVAHKAASPGSLTQMGLLRAPRHSDLGSHAVHVITFDSAHACQPAALVRSNAARYALAGTVLHASGADVALMRVEEASLTIGVEAGVEGKGLEVWPQPARGRVWVRLPQCREGEALHLVSTTGQVLRRWETGCTGPLELPLEDVPPGAYLLRLNGSGAPLTRRLILH